VLEELDRQCATFRDAGAVSTEVTFPLAIAPSRFLELLQSAPSFDRHLLLPLVDNIAPFIAANPTQFAGSGAESIWISLVAIESRRHPHMRAIPVSSVCFLMNSR
jgi:hypothetical protein